MQSQDRNKVAYYAALSIFCGSLELFIPKILPFFRLGIANIPIVLALDLPIIPFLSLLILKGIGNSYISGNLFSIFSIVSISQTLASGILMYGMKKALKNKISNYGLSLSGAIISTYTQIFLASLYIGKAITSLLPLMLSLSFLSAMLVGYLSYKIELPQEVPQIEIKRTRAKDSSISIISLLLSGLAVMMIKTPEIAFIAFLLALTFQHLAGRKIKLLPHIVILLTMVFSSLLTPMGEVLISIGSIAITKDSLLIGIQKALSLSAGVSISQGYSQIIDPGKGIIGKTLNYFTALLASFRDIEESSLLEKTRKVLSLQYLETSNEKKNTNIKSFILTLYSLAFIGLMVISRIYP